jgi:hypothetical protein
MTHVAVRTAAALALGALAACGSGVREPEPLVVSARSGARVGVSGTTWEICRADTPVAGASQLSRIVQGEDGVVTYAAQNFTGPGCAGTPATSLASVSAVAFMEGDRAVGWLGTPPSDALTPPVPASPVATRVFLDGGVFIGADCFWLDDVSVPRVLYACADESTLDADNYPNQLRNVGWPEVR